MNLKVKKMKGSKKVRKYSRNLKNTTLYAFHAADVPTTTSDQKYHPDGILTQSKLSQQ